jgi:hypothetical protein
METLKQKAIRAISFLPDTAGLDDIMYRIYNVKKIKEEGDAVGKSRVLKTENGYTLEEEDEILKSVKDARKSKKVFSSVKELLNHLNK